MSSSFSSGRAGGRRSRLVEWLFPTPDPRTFQCGVRVTGGEVPGLGRRWQFRRSTVDPLAPDGIVTLFHGSGRRLRLKVDVRPMEELPEGTARPGHVIVTATESDLNARLELSVNAGDLPQFGFAVGW